MPIPNAEKQARFRKKQELKKFKDQVFKECQIGMGFRHRQEAPKELLAHLETAASLPSGWNEEDLKRAWLRVYQLRYDYTHPQDDLRKDVEDGAGLTEVFNNRPELFRKLRSDMGKSIHKTRALASHLISAMELSALSSAEQAAAVMEVIRHVGRATASSTDIAKSYAMTICQASLPSHYRRPDWFLDSLTKWLTNRLGRKLVRELGKRLANFQQEEMP